MERIALKLALMACMAMILQKTVSIVIQLASHAMERQIINVYNALTLLKYANQENVLQNVTMDTT